MPRARISQHSMPLAAACGTLCLLMCSAALAARGNRAEKRLWAKELALEVVVSTSLRESDEVRERYCDGLAKVAKDLFRAREIDDDDEREPDYRVTIEHTGRLKFGRSLRRNTTKGTLVAIGGPPQPGTKTGKATRHRWTMSVKRRCKITFAIFKRAGRSFRQVLRFSFDEPGSRQEETYGGVRIDARYQVVGDPKPRNPADLPEAREIALSGIKPEQNRIRAEIYTRLLEPEIVHLEEQRGPRGREGRMRSRPVTPNYTATVRVSNRTPWYIHKFAGTYYGRARHARGTYRLGLDFGGTIPPGKRVEYQRTAKKFSDDREGPPGYFYGLRCSVDGEDPDARRYRRRRQE